jgi:dihydroflavonol-4-reductase
VQRLNYDITRNLFDQSRKKGLKKIVYLASIFTLGGGGRKPVNEDTAYNLEGLGVVYVKAKRRAELYVREQIQKGLPVVRVYPCFCYGPGDVNISSSRLILSYLKRSLPGYIRGGQNIMDVRDAAQGLYLGMNKGSPGKKYIVGGENLSYTEIFTLLEKIAGYSRPKVTIPRRLGKVLGSLNQAVSSTPFIDKEAAEIMGHYWYYDDTRARRELGHSSRQAVKTLRDAVHWLCREGLAPWPPHMRDFSKE